MCINDTREKLLRLDLQFFGEEGASDNATDGAENATDKADDAENGQHNDEKIRRFIQSEVDRIVAEERKKSAVLTKENEKLKKEKMTADELKKYEDEQKAKELADREQAIADRENRYYALNAVLKANIGVDSDVAEEVVELVIGTDNDEIDKKIATLSKVVNKLSANKVDVAFKTNGRNPKGAGSATNGESEKKSNIAEQLGKKTAEANKQANTILNYYLGGNK